MVTALGKSRNEARNRIVRLSRSRLTSKKSPRAKARFNNTVHRNFLFSAGQAAPSSQPSDNVVQQQQQPPPPPSPKLVLSSTCHHAYSGCKWVIHTRLQIYVYRACCKVLLYACVVYWLYCWRIELFSSFSAVNASITFCHWLSKGGFFWELVVLRVEFVYARN